MMSMRFSVKNYPLHRLEACATFILLEVLRTRLWAFVLLSSQLNEGFEDFFAFINVSCVPGVFYVWGMGTMTSHFHVSLRGVRRTARRRSNPVAPTDEIASSSTTKRRTPRNDTGGLLSPVLTCLVAAKGCSRSVGVHSWFKKKRGQPRMNTNETIGRDSTDDERASRPVPWRPFNSLCLRNSNWINLREKARNRTVTVVVQKSPTG